MISFSYFNVVEPFREPIENHYKNFTNKNEKSGNKRPQTLFIEKNISNITFFLLL